MDELIPFGFAATGKVLDSLTTNLYCGRFGTERECSNFYREQMDKHGIWKSTGKRQLVAQGILLGTGLGLYGMDKLLGIENELINFHKGWLYGFGGLTYVAALNNSAVYLFEWIKEKRTNKN